MHTPHPRDQIFSFHNAVSVKDLPNNMFAGLVLGRCPRREILDPPLN